MKCYLAKNGDRRTRAGFLWYPRLAYNRRVSSYELRWLERAEWEEIMVGGLWSTEYWL